MIEAGEIALKILGWIWGHKTLAALILLACVTAGLGARLSIVTIERDAAQAQIEAAQSKEKTAVERANAYAMVNEKYAAGLEQRDALLNLQSAAADKLGAAAAQAEAQTRAAAATNRALQTALDASNQSLEDEAHATPADVRDLGPLVLRHVDGLRRPPAAYAPAAAGPGG